MFQEYLAALYLSTDKYAIGALLKEIKEESGDTPSCLVDVVRPLGLENVILFLFGLLPTPTEKLSKQLSSLFVIRQCKVMRKKYQCDIQYELDLFHECTNDNMRSLIATAMLNAPVVKDYTSIIHGMASTFHVANSGSHHLLNYFTDKQRLMFLQKVYN